MFCQLLTNETMNFNELLHQISNGCGKKITSSVLSQTLKELEEHNLVLKRTLIDYVPIRCEYQLTDKGKELRIIYGMIKQWTFKWFDEEKIKYSMQKNCWISENLPDIQSKDNLILELPTE